MEAKNTIHINKALNRNKVEIIVPLVRGKSKVIEVLIDYTHQLFSSIETNSLDVSIYKSDNQFVIIFSSSDKNIISQIADDIIDTLDKKGCTLCVNLL